MQKNGLGQLGRWRNDGVGWLANSDYFEFGEPGAENRMSNNMAYYLESQYEDQVQELKLILNINNPSYQKEAFVRFEETILKTFQSIDLNLPKELATAIKKKKKFLVDDNRYKVLLEKNQSRIESWKLTITSKMKSST